MNEKLEHWLNDTLSQVTAEHALSIHLDELLEKPINLNEYLTLGLVAFGQLVELLQILQFPIKPMLVIPLASHSSQISRIIPSSMSDLETELTPEPPSLYLLDWTPVECFGVCEEYRSPLPFNLLTQSGVYVYYREYRYEMDILHDWEFMRAIYVNYWPQCSFTVGSKR
jgi:hypothetical protein